jgi:hypothetical protein
VAQVKQDNGNTISFYDLEGSALITGEGLAGNPPAFPADMPTGTTKLVEAWNKVSGGKAAPQALVDFQNRLAANLAPSANLKVTKTMPKPLMGGLSAEDVPLNTPEGTLATPTGCNNGCCDQTWLNTFAECQVWLDWHWNLFNYGYSYANAGDVNYMEAFVCSAVGTSTWTFTVNGKGFTTPVLEAHYMESTWDRGEWPPPISPTGSMNSTVNNAANSHLHTHCGIVQYF